VSEVLPLRAPRLRTFMVEYPDEKRLNKARERSKVTHARP